MDTLKEIVTLFKKLNQLAKVRPWTFSALICPIFFLAVLSGQYASCLVFAFCAPAGILQVGLYSAFGALSLAIYRCFIGFLFSFFTKWKYFQDKYWDEFIILFFALFIIFVLLFSAYLAASDSCKAHIWLRLNIGFYLNFATSIIGLILAGCFFRLDLQDAWVILQQENQGGPPASLSGKKKLCAAVFTILFLAAMFTLFFMQGHFKAGDMVFDTIVAVPRPHPEMPEKCEEELEREKRKLGMDIHGDVPSKPPKQEPSPRSIPLPNPPVATKPVFDWKILGMKLSVTVVGDDLSEQESAKRASDAKTKLESALTTRLTNAAIGVAGSDKNNAGLVLEAVLSITDRRYDNPYSDSNNCRHISIETGRFQLKDVSKDEVLYSVEAGSQTRGCLESPSDASLYRDVVRFLIDNLAKKRAFKEIKKQYSLAREKKQENE